MYITIGALLKHYYRKSRLFIYINPSGFVCSHASKLRGLLICCVQGMSMVAKVVHNVVHAG
jgi:hypothetical protein